MKFYSTSCKGLSHSCNEDSFAATDNMAVVADGMGGENAGEVASRLVVENLLLGLKNHDFAHMTEPEIFKCMSGMFVKCDSFIREYSMEHAETAGMGTTAVVAQFIGPYMYVCWCGDSRCFVYNTDLKRITFSTRDHSYVQELIDNGKIGVRESFAHPDNNMITRFVGGGDEYVVPECARHECADGDIVILCSDGLTGYYTNEEIMATITSAGDNPKEICDNLRQLAIRRGSEDDVTIMVGSPKSKSGWTEYFPFNLFKK